MRALQYKHFSIARWLLSLPGLDPNLIDDEYKWSAVHFACEYGAPLDLVIKLAKLSSWETLNRDTLTGTPLEWSILNCKTSNVLYLSWLGVECREDRKKYSVVTLQNWIEADCQQEAQYWAVAANDLESLKYLSEVEKIQLDRENLRDLAKLFNRQTMVGYVTKLEGLAWERVRQTAPASVNLPPTELLEKNVPWHVVSVIVNLRKDEKVEDERELLFSRFFTACKKTEKDLELPRYFLNQDPSIVNMQDEKGETVLMANVGAHAESDLVRWLLSLPGLDVDVVDNSGKTALQHACNLGMEISLDLIVRLAKLSSWQTVNRIQDSIIFYGDRY